MATATAARQPWRVSARADSPGVGEVALYGDLGSDFFSEGITDEAFRAALDALGDVRDINVYVNSPGGDVNMGISIYNQLKRHPARVLVHVDGMAASAASVVCMAGDHIIMPRGAQMMIHNTQTRARGDRCAMQKAAEVLERTDTLLADIYAARTGKNADDVRAMMDAETWMRGAEALKNGFCDEVEDGAQVAACADVARCFARYDHPPEWAEATDNGGESQPVADNVPDRSALDAQKRRFWSMRSRMMEGLV